VTWLCTKASHTFSGTFGTFSGTSLILTRRLHQCTPELFWAEDPISSRCWGKKTQKTEKHRSKKAEKQTKKRRSKKQKSTNTEEQKNRTKKNKQKTKK
jgi:hypothetical protein